MRTKEPGPVFGNFRARAPTPQSLSLIPSRCQSVSPSLISSDSLRETTVHIRIVRVLILHVVDGLLTVNPSIIVTQRRLMERLRSSETLSVRSAHLISVRVRLRFKKKKYLIHCWEIAINWPDEIFLHFL